MFLSKSCLNTLFVCVFIMSLFLALNSWGSRLIYGDGDASTLDPITNSNMVSVRLCELIYSGLLDFDDNNQPIWKIAIGEPKNKNQMEYTFTLRNVFWHNSQQRVTPEDIQFTVDAMKGSPSRKSMVDFIYKVRKDSDTDVTFILNKPIINVKGRVAFKIIPMNYVQKLPITRDNPITTKPIGCGPYKFVRSNISEGKTYLKKNEKYFDNSNPRQIDEIERLYCSTEDLEFNSLLLGAINMAISLHPKYEKNIKESSNESTNTGNLKPREPIAVHPYNPLTIDFFAFNLSPLRNTVGAKFLRGNGNVDNGIKVRQALNYGTNRQEWLDKFMEKGGDLVSGPFPVGSPYYNNEVPVYIYNPQLADKLLKEAGYSLNSSGKRVNKDGEVIKLTALVRIASSFESELWQILESDLSNLGIELERVKLDIEKWKTTVYEKHDFDIVFDSRSFAGSGEIYSIFHSSQSYPGGDNYTSYSNKYVDSLLDMTRKSLDSKQVENLYKSIHDKIRLEAPYIFLWSPYKYAFAVKRIRNFRIEPFAFFTYVTEWYMEE